MSHILIAEDEPRIASFVAKGLRRNGFDATTTADGEDALLRAQTGAFDLLILDLGLPGKDGLDVLRELRGSGATLPVVILSARNDPGDTVVGFEGGADDYITKPFRFEELLVRVRARLRHNSGTDATVVRVEDLCLDLRTRTMHVGGRALELTGREFTLAETLLRQPGRVFTREELLSSVWGFDHDPGSNVVDVYIGYLRRKLGADRIDTVRGTGYRLEARGSETDA